MRRDEATLRNALPVPDNQYVDPGQPATYRYWDEVQLVPPPGAASARIDLKYQPTSWEYIQFLYLASDKQNPFLASLGDDLLDAWLNTGMASPQVMSTAIWCRLPGSGEDFVLSTRVNGVGDPADCAKAVEAGDQLDIGFASPGGTFVGVPAGAVLQFYPTGQPPVSIPGVNVHVSEFHGQIVTAALPSSGLMVSTVIPPGLGGHTLRLQAAAITPLAANGVFAVSDAHDILLR
jgi:hypothetical protein